MSASLIQKFLRDLLLLFSVQKMRATDRSEMLVLIFKNWSAHPVPEFNGNRGGVS